MSFAHPNSSSRHVLGLMAVVALHVLVIYALVHGLARRIVEVVRPPLETRIIEEVKPPPRYQPPPPPPPKLAAPPPPFIPPPEIQIQLPRVAPTITAVTNVKPADLPPPPAAPAPPPVAPPVAARVATPHVPVKVAAVVDAKSCEKPAYPAASLRASETGIVLLGFLIDIDGTVLDSKVERSSGYRRLDEAARNALKLCRFRAATVDGKPEQSWSRIEYAWKIE